MCVLVVEDDFLIRTILVEELQDAGLDVREAESGDEAIDVIRTIQPPLRVLVTDIHMPGALSGIDLSDHLQIHLPAVPVIFTTGRPDALGHLEDLGRNRFLVRKPYELVDIVARVKNLMAS